jgi:hypothetical protein
LVASLGVAATPLTFGASLVLTAIGIGMLTWDGVDYAREHSRYMAIHRRLRELDREVRWITKELTIILETLDRRSGTNR